MIKPSPTLELAQRISKARENGETAYSMSTPTFSAPAEPVHPVEPLSLALTPAAGLPELRALAGQALFDKWDLAKSDVLITAGAKAACFSILKAVTSPGESALIIAPAWPSYEEICTTAGLKPHLLQTQFKDDFAIDPEALSHAMSETGAKVILLSNPNNPSGRIYSEQELHCLQSAAQQHDAWLILDESFSHVCLNRTAWQASVLPAYPKLVVINSFSKNFHMQGLRLGAILVPNETAPAVLAIHQSIASSAASASQQIAISMLVSGARLTHDYSEQYGIARDFADTMHWKYLPTAGTFYLFPKLPDVALFRALAAERDVYLLTGDTFGPAYADHIRFCFGKPVRELRIMLERLADISVAA